MMNDIEKILAKKRRKSIYQLIIPAVGEFLIMAAPNTIVKDTGYPRCQY